MPEKLRTILERAGLTETQIDTVLRDFPKPDAIELDTDPNYLRGLLTEAGLSQRGAARILGIPNRTFRAFTMGETPCPYTVQYALEVLSNFPQKDPSAQSEVDHDG